MLYSSLFYLQECVCNEKCPLEFPSKNSLAVDVSCSLGDPRTGQYGFFTALSENYSCECKFSSEVLRYIGICGHFVWFGVILCSLPSGRGGCDS